MWAIRILFLIAFSALVVNCSNVGSMTPLNQGTISQDSHGNLKVYLNNKGFKENARFGPTTIFTAYIYKNNEYQLECGDDEFCEDKLIFRNDRIDSMGFSTDPGFYGYDSDRGTYSPRLNASEPFGEYPKSRPPIPSGFGDSDVFQCYYLSYRNGYQCGINPNPIRTLDTSLSQFFLDVFAADAQGFPSFYIQNYNHFQSLNHPVSDSDRYFLYLAVHFDAITNAERSEDRYKSDSSIWSRPIKPDLISPRVPIKIKLLKESPHDMAGGTYPIPDFSTWRSPRCNADTVTPGDVFISEIMWMGSVSINGVNDNSDEFLEIYNNTNRDLQIGGYKITGAGPTQSGNATALEIPDCTTIKAKKTITIGKKNNGAFPSVTIVNSQLTLRNSGTSLSLTLKDANGTTVSSLGSDCQGTGSSAWGGKGTNTAGVVKQSMALGSVPANASSYNCADFITTPTSNVDGVSSSHAFSTSTNKGTAATPGKVPW